MPGDYDRRVGAVDLSETTMMVMMMIMMVVVVVQYSGEGSAVKSRSRT